MSVSVREMDEAALELGYVQSQAAGGFRWYEYPGIREVYERRLTAFVRVEFYAPESELRVWIQRPNLRGNSNDSLFDVFHGNVESVEEVEEALRLGAHDRMRVAVQQLAGWGKLAPIPYKLIQAWRSAQNPEDKYQAEVVAIDWLLDHGVPF